MTINVWCLWSCIPGGELGLRFASLAGLRHVSDDMKTHKNPALKNQGGPVRSGPKPFTAPKPACNANPSQGSSPKAPPLLELEGKKWRVVSSWCWQGWRGGSFGEAKGALLETFLLFVFKGILMDELL